jgi:hypothetical protein
MYFISIAIRINNASQITGMKTGWAHLIFLLDWFLSNEYQFYTKYYNQVCRLKLILLILGIYLSNIFLPHCDALKLTFSCVFFSDAGGSDSLVVDAWNLRPSVFWKDGQWTEWSGARERKCKSNKV